MLIPIYGNDEEGNEILLDIIEEDEEIEEDYDFFNNDFLLEY